MTRRLLLLNGLAILAVILNHAAHTAPLPMYWWTFRYSPGTAVPNYDQFGTVTYYVLIAAIKLTYFAVPSFLFVSGFFVSFIARGHQSALNLKTIGTTIARLLGPYLIWSLSTIFIHWLQSCLQDCTANSPNHYVKMLLTGEAHDAYWYVLLITQCYLLSPLLVALAKTHLRLLLLITALAHGVAIIVIYLGLFTDLPIIANVIIDGRFFLRDVIYFVFGIAAGFHLATLKQWLARFKWFLLVALAISAILSIVEAEFIYRILGGGYNYMTHIYGGNTTAPMTLYIFMFILCFLAFDNVNYPFSTALDQLGAKSYGIYLLHPFFIQLMPKIFYRIAPWLLAYQILYQPALVAVSLGIPFLFMTLVAKSRMRFMYRYLFG
jgi:surface polysaccharide O-acyltransferase-like enzyme